MDIFACFEKLRHAQTQRKCCASFKPWGGIFVPLQLHRHLLPGWLLQIGLCSSCFVQNELGSEGSHRNHCTSSTQALAAHPGRGGIEHPSRFDPRECLPVGPALGKSFALGSAFTVYLFLIPPHLVHILFQWVKVNLQAEIAGTSLSKGQSWPQVVFQSEPGHLYLLEVLLSFSQPSISLGNF